MVKRFELIDIVRVLMIVKYKNSEMLQTFFCP